MIKLIATMKFLNIGFSLILTLVIVPEVFAQRIFLKNQTNTLRNAYALEQLNQANMYQDDPTVSYSISEELCPPVANHRLEQPKRFIRQEELNFSSEYYFTSDDEVIRCVTYDIDLESMGYGYDENSEINKGFITKFYETIESLTNHFGKPISVDKEPQEVIRFGTSFLFYEAIWQSEQMYLKARLSPGKREIAISQYWMFE